jgi:hypothetical protein
VTSVQPPEGLREIAYEAADLAMFPAHVMWYPPHEHARLRAAVDAVLAALVDACEVREENSVVFYDGFRATDREVDVSLLRTWLDSPAFKTVGPMQRRTVATWPDGWRLISPWRNEESVSECPSAKDGEEAP